MNPRPIRRRRSRRGAFPLLLVLLLLLLAFFLFVPEGPKGIVRYFTGGEDQGAGGGRRPALDGGVAASAAPVDWEAVRAKLAETARQGEATAGAKDLGEAWRALANALDAALAKGEVGTARRALSRARHGWLSAAPDLQTAADALEREVEEAARRQREVELERARAALTASDHAAASRAALALLRSGDESVFAEAGRIACAARDAEGPLDSAARASAQAQTWKRGISGLSTDVLLDELLGLVTRCGDPAEAPAVARFAHELARCAYPARRVRDDLEGDGVEVRWPSAGEGATANVRSRGGVLELRVSGSESYEPMRTLGDPELLLASRELFEPLGLEAEDARSALAALLARSGDREAARRALAAKPAMVDEERQRFLAALGG